jgi:hypothetical protein
MTDTNSRIDAMDDDEFFEMLRTQSGYKKEIEPESIRILDDFVQAKIPESDFRKTLKSDLDKKYSDVVQVVDKNGELAGYNFTGYSGQKESLDFNALRKKRQEYILQNIDTEQGANILDRLLTSLPKKEIGRYNILRNKYGAENVIPQIAKNNDVEGYFIRGDDGQFRTLNKKGLDLGDVVGLTGGAIENVPGVVASTVAASRGAAGPVQAAIGGAADLFGSVTRQGAAELAGAGGEMSVGERLADVGTNAASGLAGEGLVALGKAGIRGSKFSPAFRDERMVRNVAKNVIYEGNDPKKYAANIVEGKRLEKEIPNLKLDASQLVASEGGLGFRRTLEQTPNFGGAAAEIRGKQILALTDELDKTLNDVAGGSFSPIEAGEKVAKSISDARAAVLKYRSESAGPLFDKIDKVANNQPVIQLDNTLKAIDEISNDLTGNFTTGSNAKILTQLNSMRNEMMKGQTSELLNLAGIKGQRPVGTAGLGEFKSTAKRFQRDMSNLSKVLYGQGRLVDDIPTSQDQFMAKKLLRAMERDLDDSIASGGIAEGPASLIKDARSAWATGSKMFEKLDTETLNKIMSMYEAGNIEQLGKKFSTGVSNQNIRNTMAQIQAINPEAAQKLRASTVQEMISKAYTGGDFKPGIYSNLFGAGGKANKPGVGDNIEKLNAIFEGDARGKLAIKRLANVADAANRISRQGTLGKGGSQTAPMGVLVEHMKKIGIPLIPGSEGFIGVLNSIGHKLSDPKNLAEVYTNPEMRDQFLLLVDPPKWAKSAAITRAATRLLDDLGGDDTKVQKLENEVK